MANPDDKWMQQALALARRGEGLTRPNPPVGAVVVKGRRKLAAGYHRRAGGPHAEVLALDRAGAAARGATLYVTMEPCSTFGKTPPCTARIVQSGLRRVVVGTRDPNPRHKGKGIRLLRSAGLDVTVGVAGREAETLIEPFAVWIREQRPFATLKLGTSLDGKIGDRAGRSRWITGPVSRSAVQALRRRVDAVLVGVGTAVSDNPGLLPRPSRGREPYRIVADTHGRLPFNAKLLNDEHAQRTIVATTRHCSRARRERYRAKGACVWVLPQARGRVSLAQLFRRLGRFGLLHVLCEGGGTLAEELARAGLVDEYLFFVAPRLIGGRDAVPALGGHGWSLARAPQVRILEHVRTGSDLLIRARPTRHCAGRKA